MYYIFDFSNSDTVVCSESRSISVLVREKASRKVGLYYSIYRVVSTTYSFDVLYTLPLIEVIRCNEKLHW